MPTSGYERKDRYCQPYGTCGADGIVDIDFVPPEGPSSIEKRHGFTALVAPRNTPNCHDRTCAGAVYERSQASLRAMQLADARTECAHLERRLVEIRDEAALEIAWLKRELQRNDPRLFKARYGRSAPTGSKAEP